ncbi:hypothetical protein [Aminobacter sp. MSH1]|uniref:hypothetical protein n=1 Tax=Aminobacter sp. MSH1 TaxID=374606 RepID=UPI001FDFBFDA|nr:hypothetical protein [Aminobacter sp. MSH1]
MAQPTPRMDAQQFSAVAATCRWSERALAVARDILVDGVSLPETAAKHEITAKHARVLITRFQGMAEKYRLLAFTQKEPPKQAPNDLTPFSNDLRTLRDKGYKIDQILTYLKENGVISSATSVRKFLRSNRA